RRLLAEHRGVAALGELDVVRLFSCTAATLAALRAFAGVDVVARTEAGSSTFTFSHRISPVGRAQPWEHKAPCTLKFGYRQPGDGGDQGGSRFVQIGVLLAQLGGDRLQQVPSKDKDHFGGHLPGVIVEADDRDVGSRDAVPLFRRRVIYGVLDEISVESEVVAEDGGFGRRSIPNNLALLPERRQISERARFDIVRFFLEVDVGGPEFSSCNSCNRSFFAEACR